MLKQLIRKRKIKQYLRQIEELEAKLSRSQSSCVQAMLVGKEPDKEDMEYHHKYMESIRELRQKVRELQKQE